MDNQVRVLYSTQNKTITLRNGDKDLILALSELSQIYYLIKNKDFHDILGKGRSEMVVDIPYFENKPESFFDVVDSKFSKEKNKSREKIPKDMREDLWKLYHKENEEGPCYTCGINIVRDNDWHASHVVAASKGGAIELENLRTCCGKCSKSMGNQNLYAFIEKKKLNGPGKKKKNAYFAKNPTQKEDKRCNLDKIVGKEHFADKLVLHTATSTSTLPSKSSRTSISEPQQTPKLEERKRKEKKIYNFACEVEREIEDTDLYSYPTELEELSNGNFINIDNGIIRIWESGKDEPSIIKKKKIEHLYNAISDNTLLISKTNDDLVVWNIDTDKEILLVEEFDNFAEVLPNGMICAMIEDHIVKIWNKSFKLQCILKGHTNHVKCCDLISDTHLVTGSSDKRLMVWNLQTGVCENILRGHTRVVSEVQYLSPNRIISSASDGIKIWNLETGKCMFTLEGELINKSCLSNRNIITKLGKEVCVWDSEDGSKLYNMKCGSENIDHIFKLPNDRVITVDEDSKILKVWNVNAKKRESVYISEFPIIDVDVSRSGKICIVTPVNIKILA